LQIVDNQEPDAVLALHAPGSGADRVDRLIGRRFDIKRQGNMLLRNLGQAVEIPCLDLAFAHCIASNPALFGQHTLAQLLS
jgi:hypothetical protein